MKKKLACLFLSFLLLVGLIGCGEVGNILLNELENGLTQGAAESLPEDQNASGGLECKVHFINVDQGDSILVESRGHYMLIDAGENDEGDTVVAYLKEQGVSTLDYIIGTHPHSDHIGGMDDVLDAVTVEKAILPNVTYDTKTYQDVLDGIEAQKAEILWAEVGDTYTLGDASFIILAPNAEYTDPNNWSVGIKLVCGRNSFVMCGDAETKSERDICKNGIDLEADVLKCGHHGSNTSTSDEFLKAVNPIYAVISCGKDNKYGHPHAETIAKLQDDDVQIYRTDLSGTIIASSDGTNLSWSFEKEVTSASAAYILNTNGKKFHKPDCSYAKRIAEENRQEYTGTREQLIKDGYTPCGSCNP